MRRQRGRPETEDIRLLIHDRAGERQDDRAAKERVPV
jgi:hypothetical protein